MPRITSFTSSRALTPISRVGLPKVDLPVLRRNLHFATSEITGSGDRQVLSLTSLLDTAYLNDVVDIFTPTIFTASSIELTTGQTVTDSLRWNNTIIGDTYNINIETDGVRTWGANVAVVIPDLDTLNIRNAKTVLEKDVDFTATSDNSTGGVTIIGFTIDSGDPLAEVLTIATSPLAAFPVKITQANGRYSINFITRTDATSATVLDLPELGYPASDILSFTDIETIEVLEFKAAQTTNSTFLLQAGAATYNEGDTVSFTLYTTNIPQNVIFPYTVSGITFADLDAGNTFGTFSIGADGTDTVSWTLSADEATEGTETMTVSLSGGLAQASTSILDTSVNTDYTFTSSQGTTVNEGTSFTITLDTVGVPDDTVLAYTVTGVSENDLEVGSTAGNFTITSNQATADFQIANDRISEGTETFTLSLDNGAASISIVILDTSITPTFTLTRSTNNINEGGVVTFFVNTTNIENGFSVPWALTGVTLSDIASIDGGAAAVSGSATVSSGVASVAITLAEDLTSEGSESMTFTISPDVPGSPTDDISVVINDTSVFPTYNSITFGADSYTEGDTVSFTVSTSGVPDGATVGFTVDVASGEATPTSGTLTFESGDGTATGTFVASEDSVTEGTETFTVTLASADSRGGPTGSLSGNITILDASFGAITTLSLADSVINPLGISSGRNGRFGQSVSIRPPDGDTDYAEAIVGSPKTASANQSFSYAWTIDLTDGSTIRNSRDPEQLIFGPTRFNNFASLVYANERGFWAGTQPGDYTAYEGNWSNTSLTELNFESGQYDLSGWEENFATTRDGLYAVIGAPNAGTNGVAVIVDNEGNIISTITGPTNTPTQATGFGHRVAAGGALFCVGDENGQCWFYDTEGTLVNISGGSTGSFYLGSGSNYSMDLSEDDTRWVFADADFTTNGYCWIIDLNTTGDVLSRRMGGTFGLYSPTDGGGTNTTVRTDRGAVSAKGGYAVFVSRASSTERAIVFDIRTGTELYWIDEPSIAGGTGSTDWGISVACDGGHVVIGDPQWDPTTPLHSDSIGIIYIYDLPRNNPPIANT